MIFGSQPTFARRALAERVDANIHRKVLAGVCPSRFRWGERSSRFRWPLGLTRPEQDPYAVRFEGGDPTRTGVIFSYPYAVRFECD